MDTFKEKMKTGSQSGKIKRNKRRLWQLIGEFRQRRSDETGPFLGRLIVRSLVHRPRLALRRRESLLEQAAWAEPDRSVVWDFRSATAAKPVVSGSRHRFDSWIGLLSPLTNEVAIRCVA